MIYLFAVVYRYDLTGCTPQVSIFYDSLLFARNILCFTFYYGLIMLPLSSTFFRFCGNVKDLLNSLMSQMRFPNLFIGQVLESGRWVMTPLNPGFNPVPVYGLICYFYMDQNLWCALVCVLLLLNLCYTMKSLSIA